MTPFRYVTGGTLPPDSPSYITRPCDAELLTLCRQGEFAYVLSSRQMGKSSLMARTKAALEKDGATVVAFEMTQLGSHQVDAAQWYLGILSVIESFCQPQTDLFDWWNDHQMLPLAQRLWCYLTEVLLSEVPGRIVVFVDEIDTTLGLGFTDDFFALIRALHNQRAQQPELARLSFVLLGVATPGELIADPSRTPFNIGRRIEVTDFSANEAQPLLGGLGLAGDAADEMLVQVLHWTGGQPYLTQKLCALVGAQGLTQAAQLDALAERELLSDAGRGDSHFQFVGAYLRQMPDADKAVLFDTCTDVLRGRAVVCQDASVAHNRLRLAGLMRRVDGRLQYRNELYRRVFGIGWVRRHRPTLWTRANRILAGAVGAALTVAVVFFLLYQRAENAIEAARAAELRAIANARDAIAQRVLSDANDFFGGHNRPSDGIQSLLMTLAGHRISQQSQQPFVQTAGYAALQREENRSRLMSRVLEASASISSIAWSPDGKRIVSGHSDNTLRLWNANTGTLIGEPLKGHSGVVWSVAFSPNGERIVSGSNDKTLRLWSAHSGAAVGEPLTGHSDSVRSVAFSPDGVLIVSGSKDNSLRLWDAHPRTQIGRPLEGHSKTVMHVAFSPDGTRIVSGSDDNTLRLWNSRTKIQIGDPLKGHLNTVVCVAFSPDGGRIVSGSLDNTLHLWEIRSGIPVGNYITIKDHSSGVFSVAFSPDGKNFISGSHDKTLRRWDSKSGAPVGQPMTGHSSPVLSVAFSPDGTRIISGSDDKTMRLWDANSNNSIEDFPVNGQTDATSSIAYSPDGSRVVSGRSDSTLRLWDAKSGKPIGNALRDHYDSVSSVAFSPDGTRIVSGSSDTTLRLWDAHSGTPIGEPFKIAGQAKYSDFSIEKFNLRPDGSKILIESAVKSIAFSPDGLTIASGGENNAIRLWDTRSRTLVHGPLRGHMNYVLSVAFSPDGARIVSGSYDNTLRLWGARSGASIGEALGHSSPVLSVAFNPNGKYIVSGSSGNTPRWWPILEGWAEELCAKIPRNMSHKEWREWISPDIPYTEQCPGKPIPTD